MIILGLDPGLASTGFGAILCGSGSPSLQTCGYIATSARDPIAKRLLQLHTDLDRLIESVEPQLVALENVFSLVRYPRAGILLGEVLGIIYVIVQKRGLPIIEIAPKEVKNALVGSGSASKAQVKATARKILGVKGLASFHAADAVAVALTAYYRKGYAESV